MAKVSGSRFKPAVKLPPTQNKQSRKQKEPTPELSDSDIESYDEDFEEDGEFEDVESDDFQEEVQVPKKKQRLQLDSDEEVDTGEEDEEMKDDESEEDDNEFDVNPKSFVLAVDDKEESENDSDREVEIALKAGLVKATNILQKHSNVISKYMVNNIDAMKKRLEQMKSKQPWINNIDVAASPELVFVKKVDDDFEREAIFHKQASDSVEKAVTKLKELKIPVLRPDDYFAEMAKSDRHMQRIRKVLIEKQKETERRETVRRLRNEKKFVAKVQKEVEQRKIVEKRKFTDAVKKARKGMKGQLETMLNNASKLQDYDDEEAETEQIRRKPKMTRTARNKKFGSGGFKNNKRNDKRSFENIEVTGKKARFSKKVFSGKKRR